jgi:hypothetical protein
MNAENADTCFRSRRRKFDFSVNPSRPEKSYIEDI